VVVPLVVVDGVEVVVVVDDVAALASAAPPPARAAVAARVTIRGLIRFRKPLPPLDWGLCENDRSSVSERRRRAVRVDLHSGRAKSP